MRHIPSALRRHHEEQEWWTPETLGEISAHGLSGCPDAQVRVYCAVRPYAGTDRKSDMIVRGGENISALEVEEVLLG